MKKTLVIITMILVALIVTPIIHADVFPKPQTLVIIKGVDKPYSFDLLKKSTEAPVLDEEAIKRQVEHQYYQSEYPSILNGYMDSDSYASYTLYTFRPHHIKENESVSGERRFHIGYFSAPSTFKVVIVTEDDKIISSKPITRARYDTVVTFDLTGVDLSIDQMNVGKISQNAPNVWGLIGNYLLRVLATILIELGILWLFMYKTRRTYSIAALTNFITQSALTIYLIYGQITFGIAPLLFILIAAEIIIILVEMIVYATSFKEGPTWKAILYALFANFVTILVSYLAIIYFPH